MKHRSGSVVALVLPLMLIAAACSSSSSTAVKKSTGAGTTVMVDGQKANDHGKKDVSGGGSEGVEVDDFYFNPTVFTGKAGDKLTLTLSNDSKTLHNFSMPTQRIDRDIIAGGKVTVSVTFPTSGTVVFFCKYHRSSGMLGGLQVEAS